MTPQPPSLTTPALHSADVSSSAPPIDGLALLLRPRQADIMRVIWAHGHRTVHEILARLSAEPALAYTTVMTICVRLTEKGLLERQQVDLGKRRAPTGHPYRYAALIDEQSFVRSAVSARLAELQTAFPDLVDVPSTARPHATLSAARSQIECLLAELGGLGASDAALDQIAVLLERAEAAERRAACWAEAARRAERLHANANRRTAQARPAGSPAGWKESARAAAGTPIERGRCRVCDQPAPLPHCRRADGLRVCADPHCKAEARRRDNNAKQRRYNERRQAS